MNKKKDFHDFLSTSSEIAPSMETERNILNFVKEDLKPNPFQTFSELIGIHAVVGFITLLICPQFDISLTGNEQVFHFLHRTFGANLCMAICGAIFIGSGALFASSILKTNKLRQIENYKYLYYLLIPVVALLAFLMAGGDIYLEMAIFWILGASISSIALLEIHLYVRKMAKA